MDGERIFDKMKAFKHRTFRVFLVWLTKV